MEDEKEYLSGPVNRAIRYYYYLENGLTIVNDFRNLILAILGVYIVLKLSNPLWLAGMFLVSTILLTVAGYYYIHKFAKVKEWVSVRFSSHFAIRSYDYQKRICELLEEIKKLKKDKIANNIT